jgi:phage terminase large subunit GpA-like protein
VRATQEISRLLRGSFKPKQRLGISDWIEANVFIKNSSIPGRYSIDETPALRQIYEDIGNPRIRKISVAKGAQLGVSQLASNVILYYVCNDSLPVGCFFPNDTLARQFNEKKFSPSLEQCEAAAEFSTGNKDDERKLSYLFTSCSVDFIGAGSPAKLASNSFALLLIDEADKLVDHEAKGEADSISLAEKRTLSFQDDRKILLFSTPSEVGLSRIWPEYLKSSASKYQCPCPFCAHPQELVFDQVRFSHCKLDSGKYDLNKVKTDAFYECVHCKGKIDERLRREMVSCGEWKATNSEGFDHETRSYHLTALMFFWITMGELAVEWIQAQDDVCKLHDWFNNYAALPFQNRATSFKDTDIDTLVFESPEYYKGNLHQKPDVLLAAFDKQMGYFWYSVLAVNRDDSLSLISWGKIMGWEDVQTVLNTEYQYNDQTFRVARAVCDAKFQGDEVMDACCRWHGLLFPIKGDETGFVLGTYSVGTHNHKGILIVTLPPIQKTTNTAAPIAAPVKISESILMG